MTVEYKVVACWIDGSNSEGESIVVSQFGITEADSRYVGLSKEEADVLADSLEGEGYFDVKVCEFV